MQIVLGPVVTRKGGYALDCWTPMEELRSTSLVVRSSASLRPPTCRAPRVEILRGITSEILVEAPLLVDLIGRRLREVW
jgi:hypothetical protein